jgi:hypothetical protein
VPVAVDEAQAEARARIIDALTHPSFRLVGVADYAPQIADVVLAEFPTVFWCPAAMGEHPTRVLYLRTNPEPTPA